MKISLVQLRLLEAVAETGSVGAAARRLRLTQSGASQAIATLEKILGVEVLARKRDGAALTAFGQSILADAKAALQAIDRIEVQARCRASGAPERLRVAAIPSQLQYVLPGLRKTFQRLYPGIEFSAFEGGHDDVSLWVRDGIADLGITSLPTPELEAREIGREELVVVGRRDDPFMRNDTVAAEELRNRQLIAAAGCEMIIDRIIHGDGETRSEQVRTRDVATVLEMVRHGIGTTLLSEISLPDADLHGLRARRLNPPTFRTVYIVFRADSPVRHLIDRFCDVALQARSRAA
ncbi:molybdate transport repressor ModE-like protein [Ochrobactrum intermedium]|jgi:molybdate transport repressor ModE-like protein|uniref:Molybdate transport repressor ModE-like protein n=1 Tax=Brucella intermedia TaxID=94625 RepID=A0ABR6AI98_9HYPH|nr:MULTISPECIES: LysR family transcriptional regulator [Brucella/Ochrobactrum group]KAB2708893.1 LysR family transcriptional regulator [Brucella intermedia]MBA8849196.1 molybdate transport repressor ModE-like protein [Brucella intermedia]MPR60370.1 LysR family transcriptional regulator [Brucella intermedia]NVM40888.1 LysR family transcriptional regulator [Brucella intermedia]NYD82720.1 molybdate transport repressor ModE-like protein [Brucella intermedia]